MATANWWTINDSFCGAILEFGRKGEQEEMMNDLHTVLNTFALQKICESRWVTLHSHTRCSTLAVHD